MDDHSQNGKLFIPDIKGVFGFLETDILGNKDIADDLKRASESVEKDPRDSITASCSFVEGVCKYILSELGVVLPVKQTIRPLVHAVLNALNLAPETQDDEDLRRISGGLLHIAQRIGSLRTNFGDAHGPNSNGSTVLATYARLTLGSALTLANFLIEISVQQENFVQISQETMQRRISNLLKKYNRTFLDLDSDDPLPFRFCPKCGSKNLNRKGAEPNLSVSCGDCKIWSLKISGDKIITESYPADLLKGRK